MHAVPAGLGHTKCFALGCMCVGLRLTPPLSPGITHIFTLATPAAHPTLQNFLVLMKRLWKPLMEWNMSGRLTRAEMEGLTGIMGSFLQHALPTLHNHYNVFDPEEVGARGAEEREEREEREEEEGREGRDCLCSWLTGTGRLTSFSAGATMLPTKVWSQCLAHMCVATCGAPYAATPCPGCRRWSALPCWWRWWAGR